MSQADVSLLSITPEAEKHIERCTRICYNSESKMTSESHIVFLPGIMKRGHWSALSHAHATFVVKNISRACSHQLVRHAHLRYLQRSQRYCTEETNNTVIPEVLQDNKVVKTLLRSIKDKYNYLVKKKVKLEDARYILPNACTTEIVVSGTLQGWWDFLRLRMGKSAQQEIRDVAKKIYVVLNAQCPHVFTKELLVVQVPLYLEFPENE